MENFKVGDRVKILAKNFKGEIAFIGETHFAHGTWFGIILDEPKGMYDGTIKGISYFKCPKNQGTFVRACKVEKVYEDTKDVYDKTSASCRIIYPNYLKSSSKLEKKSCKLNNLDENNTKYPVQSIGNPNCETFTTANTCEKNLNLNTIKQENEDLKKKLKDTEKLLQENIQKYTKAMEEIKRVKENLECKNRQIKIQKSHLKLLKMKQCNHYKKVDSFPFSSKKAKKMGKGDCSVNHTKMVSEDSSFSEDEFDLESMKAFVSTQRTVELEEQNRIMIEGLVELREFLKSKCQSHFMDIEIQPKLKMENAGSCSFDSNYSSTELDNDGFPVDESESQMKEYKNMLWEMRKFSEIMKGKGCSASQFGTTYSTNIQNPGDFAPYVNEHMPQGNRVIEMKHDLTNKPGSNNNTCFENSSSQMVKEAFQKNGNQNSFHQQADKTFQLQSEVADKSSLNTIGDTISNLSYQETDPTELAGISVPKAKEVRKCVSNLHSSHQELPLNTKNLSSNYTSCQSKDKFQQISPRNASDIYLQSSGDNCQVLSKGMGCKGKLFCNHTYQGQEMGIFK